MSVPVRIYGASDDLVEVEGCKDADEFYTPGDLMTVWNGDLTAPDGSQMRVYATYDGCWHFSVGQVEEGVLLPSWPVVIDQFESGYSTVLLIEAPDGTRLTNVGDGERIMTEDVIDAEIIPDDERPNVAALAVVEHHDALVRPAASVDDIAQAFADYQALSKRLLDESDYQTIGKGKYAKTFRKKSAWRKLATAMGVTFEIVDRQHEREGRHIIRSEFVVRATAPNGRSCDGWGACDAFERCCPSPCPKRSWDKHECCRPDCDGVNHFTHAQHDIPATAETRAKNRAASDLFGMGEVSAEEIVGPGERQAPSPPPSSPSSSRGEQPSQPAAPAGDRSEPSEAQIRKLAITLRELGVDDDAKRVLLLKYGEGVTSTKQLTKSQVSALIDSCVKSPERVKKAAGIGETS